MSFGYQFRAEYASGFVLTDDEPDESPYAPGRNAFHSVYEGHPVEEHGALVRLSLIGPERRFDIDWRDLTADPDVVDARPIYFKDMTRELDTATGEWVGDAVCHVHRFGFQYLSAATGRNVQEIEEMPG